MSYPGQLCIQDMKVLKHVTIMIVSSDFWAKESIGTDKCVRFMRAPAAKRLFVKKKLAHIQNIVRVRALDDW